MQYSNRKIMRDKSNIIEADYLERNNSTVPVIYQPKIDAWENFLREINVYKNEEERFFSNNTSLPR